MVVYTVVGAAGVVREGCVKVDPYGDAAAAVVERHLQPSWIVASPAVADNLIVHTVVEPHSQPDMKDQR